jgi:hypothetical protein
MSGLRRLISATGAERYKKEKKDNEFQIGSNSVGGW